MENVIVDQPVDIIDQEARIQNRVDVVPAGVAMVGNTRTSAQLGEDERRARGNRPVISLCRCPPWYFSKEGRDNVVGHPNHNRANDSNTYHT